MLVLAVLACNRYEVLMTSIPPSTAQAIGFLKKIGPLIQHEQEAGAVWKSISGGMLSKIESTKSPDSKTWQQKCHSDPSQVVRDDEELLDAAMHASSYLTHALQPVVQQFHGVTLQSGLSLKSKARISEKAASDYADRAPGPPLSYLYDVLRASITCQSEDQIVRVVQRLKSLRRGVVVARLKNRFISPSPSGYRDVLLKVLVQCGGFEHMAEVQIQHVAFKTLERKHKSHKFYECFRSFWDQQGDDQASVQRRWEGLRLIGPLRWESLHELVAAVSSTQNYAALVTLFELLDYLNQTDYQVLLCEAMAELLIREEVEDKGTKTADWLIQVGNKVLGLYEEIIQFQIEGNKEGSEATLIQLEKALGYYYESLRLCKRNHGDLLPDVAFSLYEVAGLYLDQGNWDSALFLFKETARVSPLS